jgi:glutamine---fructose-6-phosphate transaminase (isomerizing)
MSAMSDEIAECAQVVRGIRSRRAEIADVASRLDFGAAKLALVCGRGSSGHASVYLRYLIETRLGLPVSSVAPSLFSAFKGELRLDRAPFFVISQSGRSPDLVVATQRARACGARTVAIVNDANSPVAEAAECVLPLEAGLEKSVAATKSVVSSMALGAGLIASVAQDKALDQALDRLPDRLTSALSLDWQKLLAPLGDAQCAFVTARGFGLGVAREIALKLSETLRLPAFAYSAAEFLHGPRAALGARMPVLALRLNDGTASSVDATVQTLRAAGQAVSVCGGIDGDLGWIGDDHPAVDAIAMLVPAYRLIEKATRRAGFDPDNPPYLKKVTETL